MTAEMQTFYITFGVQYAREQHPHAVGDVYPHPDGWFEVRRYDMGDAQEAAMKAFGGKYAFIYAPDDWEPHWFPMGKLGDLK